MAQLIINRIAENLFEHILDGVQLAIDNNPNLTTFENIENGAIVLHFKTKNGAPLVRNQEIRPQDITITDAFGGEPDVSGFTTSVAVWDYLKFLGYFVGYGGSGGGGGSAQYFKLLLDVFPQNTFAGQNGKVYVVNEANNRLEATAFYNYYRLTQMQDIENTPTEDIPNGYVLTAVTVLDENGVSQKLFGFRPQSIISQVPNGFLTLGSFELNDGVFTADTAWTWSQDGVEYGNLEEYENNIEMLPDGSSRFLVYHTLPNSNEFDVTIGEVSTDGSALKPIIPLGAIELTTIFVDGDEISGGGTPIIGAEYISKSSYGWVKSNISGANQTIIYQTYANSFEMINPALISIDSVAISTEDSYNGQLVWIYNKTGVPIRINNGASGGLANYLPFSFADGEDMVIAPNGLASFKRKDDELLLDSYNISQYSIPTFDEVADASSNIITRQIDQRLPGYPLSVNLIGYRTNGHILAEGYIRALSQVVANLGFSGPNITFSLNSPNFSNGVPISSGVGSTDANKIIYYSNAEGTPVPTTFTGRQIPDANWVNAGLALKANDADVLHKTGDEVKSGSLTVNSLLMVTPQMRIGNDSGYLQWIGLTNDLGDRRFTFESDPGVSSGKNFFIYAGGQLVQTWLESKSVFSKPIELGKYTNGTEPALISGAIYFNTSINKVKFGGVSGWEVVQSTGDTGWASYSDTVYTSASPFTITSGSTVTLPNNAGTVINTQIPTGVTSFYNPATLKILPSLDGDYHVLTIRFKAQTTAPTAGYLDFGIDIGGALGVQFKETKIFAKGAGIEHNFSIVVPLFTGSTFLANGGLVKITSGNGNITVYDIAYQINRTHKAR